MLNDKDQRTLADLEHRVVLSDPEFAARMTQRAGQARLPAVAMLCATLFVLVPPVMLLFGRPGLIVVVDLFVAGLVVVLMRRRRR